MQTLESESPVYNPDHPVYGSFFNTTGIVPAGYRILVEIPQSAEQGKYGDLLAIPEMVEDRYRRASVVAQVLQVGIGAFTDKSKTPGPPWCKPGDWIVMSPYTGVRIKSPITKTELRLLSEDCFEAVVSSPELVERSY